MKKHRPLLLLLLFFLPSAWAELPLDELTLTQALRLNSELDLEPSGLASCNGNMLMVSDKHDHLIYSLEVQNGDIKTSIFKELGHIPENPHNEIPWTQKIKLWFIDAVMGNHLDWEGISCDTNGNIFLLSETTVSVLKISPDGKLLWLKNSLYRDGSAAGIFTKTYTEGLAWSNNNQVYIAAERQPRGLIETTLINDTLTTQRVLVLENTPLPLPTGDQRVPDFTGLFTIKNNLFTLERNHSALCQRSTKSLQPIYCWSYAHIENAPEFQYQDYRYGLAEGVALHNNKLYIVFDNNKQENKANADTSPLLLEFNIPEQFYVENRATD